MGHFWMKRENDKEINNKVKEVEKWNYYYILVVHHVVYIV